MDKLQIVLIGIMIVLAALLVNSHINHVALKDEYNILASIKRSDAWKCGHIDPFSKRLSDPGTAHAEGEPVSGIKWEYAERYPSEDEIRKGMPDFYEKYRIIERADGLNLRSFLVQENKAEGWISGTWGFTAPFKSKIGSIELANEVMERLVEGDQNSWIRLNSPERVIKFKN